MRGRRPESIAAADAPLTSVPRAPTWLSKYARLEWRRVIPTLIERRLISEPDLANVEALCISRARVREIEETLRTLEKVDPVLVRAADRAMQTATRIAAELGLTPMSRSRPTMRANAEEAEADDLGLD